MNVATMRLLDRWVGVPACWLLTAVRCCADRFSGRKAARTAPIARILVIKLAEQGATVLAYPALRRAVELVGRENVFFLVFEENRFILDCLDVIPADNVIAVSGGGLLRTMTGLVRGLRQARRLRIDAAVDLEFFARSSAVLTYLSGAAVRVGLHRSNDPAPYRGDLMTHRIRYNPNLHTIEAFLLMVEAADVAPEQVAALTEAYAETAKEASQRQGSAAAAGASGPARENPRAVDETCPQLAAGSEELAAMRRKLQQEARADLVSPLVLLNANASDLIPLRRWPPERYIELASRLLDRYPSLRIAFTGAPDERACIEPLLAAIASDRCFCMAGKTTLRELLVLYHLADVLVTNDSGPAHFAALTPIQTVTLFGPETPALFGARTCRSHILWTGEPCSPCVSAYNNRLSKCRNNRCMLEIGVDEVFELVSRLLDIRSQPCS